MSEKQERAEMEALLAMPGFRKFLYRSIQLAGIHVGTTNGADGRNLIAEGRRNLGLDILHDAARGIPVDDTEAAFSLLLIQVLREGAQSIPEEKPRGRRNHNDDRDDTDDRRDD